MNEKIMKEYLNKYPSPPLEKIPWSEYEPNKSIEKKNIPNTSDIEIWSCFTITKNPCDKISMDEAYLHYSKNTLNPLSKIKFGKELIKKEGISKDFLYVGKNKNGNDYRVKCWCGVKLKSISLNIKDNIQHNIYPIDL